MALGALTSDMVNYLIWRYLQESGFAHSTFSFQDDSHAERLEGQYGKQVGSGGLIHILQKGILYMHLESSLKDAEKLGAETVIKTDFFQTKSDTPLGGDGKERHPVNSTDGDVQMKMTDGERDSDGIPAATSAVAAMAIGNATALPMAESDSLGVARHEREGSAQSQSKRTRDDTTANGTGKTSYPGSIPRIKRPRTGDGEETSVAVNGILEPDTQSEEVRATLGASIGTQVDDIIELNSTSEYVTDLAGKNDSEPNELPTACAFSPNDRKLLASAFRSGRLFSFAEDGTVSNNELQPSRTTEILEMVWSPSGKNIATGMSNGEIKIYDDSGNLVWGWTDHAAPIMSLRYHRHKNLLLSVDAMKNVVVWNVKEGKLVDFWSLADKPEILDADWIEDENFAVVGKDGTVKKYGMSKTEMAFEGHDKAADVNTIKWGNMENVFATGAEDKNVILWNSSKPSPLAILQGHTASVNRLQWCQPTEQNGNRHLLASASDDCSIRIWDAGLKACIHILEFGEAPVQGLSFSANGKYVAGGTDNAMALIYGIKSGHLLCAYNGQKAKPQENGVKENGETSNNPIDGISWDCNSEKLAFAVHGHQCVVINWKKLLESSPERPSKRAIKQ